MAKIYFTIAGTGMRHGTGFLRPGMKLLLVKEPENDYDTEAIRVELPGLGLIGYVANSVKTRIGESWSAGRIYDRIGKKTTATVRYVLPDAAVCTVDKHKKHPKKLKKLKFDEPMLIDEKEEL